jgi:hypothetical protein
VDELSASGWTLNFNWGDANAWESDWNANDDDWVDRSDFVFYTGHANGAGWVLSPPNDGFLHFTEVGSTPATPGDRWGQLDLEWAIIAACGPFQDDAISPGGGDAIERWSGAFDGLHLLLGYGAVTFDNTEEGRSVVQYVKQGATLVHAWFRTASTIQPSTNGVPPPDGDTIWAAAMWASRPDADPFNDGIWGYGEVSNDPTSPKCICVMWTTC